VKKDISVIIINYNTSKYTLECINSVIKYTSKAITYDIIVIDNNSALDDFNFLAANLPKQSFIKCHRSPINTGFGGGNMLGVQHASGNYLLFLNNDTQFKNDCLSIIFDYMESNPKVGVATAQNYDEHDNHVVSFDHNKGIRKLILGRSFLEKMNPSKYPKRKKVYQKPAVVNFVNGAFMFFRSDAFNSVGGFDTNMFLYFEEMDICYRLLQLNYTSVLIPEAKLMHYQGASSGKSKAINKEGLISYFYVIKKNYSYAKYLFIRFYFSITYIFKPKKWYLLPLVLKGSHLSESLKQQQKINIIATDK